MSEPSALRLRLLSALMLASLAVLPGCLTKALWEAGEDEDRPPTYEKVESSVERLDGFLELRGEALAGELVFVDTGRQRAWSLVPAADADLAAVLLSTSELCDVQAARLDVEHNVVGDEVIFHEAELELRGWWREGVLGVAVEADTLSADVRQLLAEPRRSGYAFAPTPDLFLPTLFAECVERARNGDLGWVLERPGMWRVQSSVFVGADGVVRFDPRNGAERYPTERELERMTLQQQLDKLASYWLIVRAELEGEVCYVRMRPDLAWLWAGFDRTSGRIVHTSRWGIEDVDVPPVVEGLRGVPTSGELRRATFERHVHVSSTGPEDFLLKIALTPVTLTLDILFVWLQGILLGDDDDDDEEGDR